MSDEFPIDWQIERSNNSALIIRGEITCFTFSYKDFNSAHMVMCLKSEQCSHVFSQPFIVYNITLFVLYCISCWAAPSNGAEKNVSWIQSRITTNFNLQNWKLKIKKGKFGRLSYISRCHINHYTPNVKIHACPMNMVNNQW